MWNAVQVMLADFQAMTPEVFPLAVPLRAEELRSWTTGPSEFPVDAQPWLTDCVWEPPGRQILPCGALPRV